MGFFSRVREKIHEKSEKRAEIKQMRAESKAKSLEAKAEYSKKLRKRLERQDAARAEIQKTKELQRAKVKKRISAVVGGLRSAANSIPKPKRNIFSGTPGGAFAGNGGGTSFLGQNKGINFGGGGTSFLGGQSKPKPKKRQRQIVIKL